jgi:predicted DNA-binding protein
VPAEQPTSIRLPRPLKKRLLVAATREKRPLSVQIVFILETWLSWWEKGQTK